MSSWRVGTGKVRASWHETGGGYNAGRVSGGVNGRGKGDAMALVIRNGGEMRGIDRMRDFFAMERAGMQGVQMFFLGFRRQKHD